MPVDFFGSQIWNLNVLIIEILDLVWIGDVHSQREMAIRWGSGCVS